MGRDVKCTTGVLSDDDREEVPWLGDDLSQTKLKAPEKKTGSSTTRESGIAGDNVT